MPDAPVRTPKPVPDRRDPRGAALSPTDGFVLSRVDGTLDEHEIVATTGLPGELVRTSLQKLESLGLITFEAASPQDARRPPDAPEASDRDAVRPNRVPPSPSPSPSPGPARPRAQSAPSRSEVAGTPPAGETPLTPEEQAILSEDVDLEADVRRYVLVTYRTLDRLDHYAVLQLDRTADRKALKRAYYELAAKFHPDKYFRKKLGSFKPLMETIFGRITLAHDTLTDRTRRAEYDAYLEEQRRSRGIEELLAAALAEANRTAERIEREAREQANREAQAAPPAAPSTAAPSPAAPTAPSPTVEAAARRDALARRLLGAGRRPAPLSSVPPPGGVNRPQSAAEAMEALRRRYEERVSLAKVAQARKYIAIGEAALAASDPVAAANAFRVALTLSPQDEGLQRQAQTAQQRADEILAETYAKQGGYEEKNGQWAESARSWARVVRARPNDALANERAANALLKADGDLHEASRLAQRACGLEPDSVPFRLTLANVYLAAGLTLNCKRELETAAQLAPHDGTIQAMLKRIGKP